MRRQSTGGSVRFSLSSESNGTFRILVKMSALVAAAISSFTPGAEINATPRLRKLYIPVMKRLTRPVPRARGRPSKDWRESFEPLTGKFLRHLRCRAAHRRRDQDEASSRKHSVRDCKYRQCFRLTHSDLRLKRFDLFRPCSARSPAY